MIQSNKRKPRTIYKKVGGGLMWFENRHITLGTTFMAYPEKIEAKYKGLLQIVGMETTGTKEIAVLGFHIGSKRNEKVTSGKVGVQRPNSKPREKVVIPKQNTKKENDAKKKQEPAPPTIVISKYETQPVIHFIENKRVRERVRRAPLMLNDTGPYRPLGKVTRSDLYRVPLLGRHEKEKEVTQYTNIAKRHSLRLTIADMELSGISRKLNFPVPKITSKEMGVGIMDKHDILSEIHRIYNPEIYFEIGVDLGVSIRLATRTAIGVDPNPNIGGNVNAAEIHKITSDSFFEQNLLKGRKPDLIFIDGLHTFDQVIRDFRNVEKHVKDNSIIVIDDILPVHVLQTPREWRKGMWTGDVWKFIPILKKYRPDLTITMLDSWPTGLMCITNFDPKNTVFWDKYDQIVKEWMTAPVPEYIYKRQNIGLRQDIDTAIRNLRVVPDVKILCYVNHYHNSSPKTNDFIGGCTGDASERKKNVQRCLAFLKSVKGMDVKVCGIPGFNLVPIDIDFTGKDPKHIPYESLNLMRSKVDQYDYFLNIEDDILIGTDVLTNAIEFEKTAGDTEILLPNRLEQRGDLWDCVDLRAISSWSGNKKHWNDLLLREATNCHSAMLFMSTKKFKTGSAQLDPSFRQQFHGGPMASAFAYFHSPFTLYRNPYPNKFHSVWHLDNWLQIQERINHTEAKMQNRKLISYIETKIPYGLNGDLPGAYNMAMASSNAEWVVLLDQDIFLCNPFWYQICLDAINSTPLNTGLITCVCNPLHGADKRTQEEAQQAEIEIRSTNIEDHIKVAERLYNKYGSTVQLVTTYKLAGYFMLVKKEIWDAIRFKSIGTGVLGIDWNYAKMLLSHGYKIYRIPGLYVYHRRGLRSLNWKLK